MDSSWWIILLGFLWSCCFYEILGAPNPGFSNSAQPPSALKVQNTIACEGQKAFASCRSIFDQIEIVETMYGRKDTSTCVHPSIPSTTVCQEQAREVDAQVRGLCDGESACEVAANNNFMAKAGTTICPNVYKYLDIKYKCIPRTTFYPNVGSSSNNGQTVNEVITVGAEAAGGLGSSAVTSSSSSSTFETSVPEITVQEHVSTQPVTTATSQASVTPVNTHNDINEEFTKPEDTSDVITETFPSNTASSSPAEVNETFRKSDTPPRPEESGVEPGVEDDESGSGILDGFDEQRDIVYDNLYRR